MKSRILARYGQARGLAVVALVATACGFSGILAHAQTDDLVTAAKRGDVAAVNALLKSGADVNNRKFTFLDGSGTSTALIEASFYGHLKVVQALLAAKADVDATRSEKKDGETALTLAVQKGHVEVVRMLLAANADVDHPCCSANALYEAARARNLDIVKVLLAAKPDLNRRSKISGTTALMWGISTGGLDIARLLLEAGADVNLSNNNGITALALAVQGKSPESLAMVRALLAAGASVDARNCNVPEMTNVSPGRERIVFTYDRARKATALGVASSLGRAEVVQTLLGAGADVNLEQCDGKTPLMLALENNHLEVAELLRSAVAASAAK